jgi:hypothetical protein
MSNKVGLIAEKGERLNVPSVCYLQNTWENAGKVVLPHVVRLGQLCLVLFVCRCRLDSRLLLLLVELFQQEEENIQRGLI